MENMGHVIPKHQMDWWTLDLQYKPDFDIAMKRIYAWYEQSIIDRPPIRFTAHNDNYRFRYQLHQQQLGKQWPTLKDRWFDAEYQVEIFINSLKKRVFNAETFPCFYPNLGPDLYAAFYGCELIFGESTSWSEPIVKEWDDISKIKLNMKNEYFQKTEELTRIGLDRCEGKFMVGYTDLHPGVDCAAAWRDQQILCMDMITSPEKVHELINLSIKDFELIFNHFDAMLKEKRQLSITWMGIPSFGKIHIPSCDFSSLISSKHWEEFCMPILLREVKSMTHNIFHLDGKGVARHLDYILEVPEINAIQWVQGVGKDRPIRQWLPLIKRIQSTGKSVVVDLQVSELEEFIDNIDPKGVLLCMHAEPEIQPDIIKRVEKW